MKLSVSTLACPTWSLPQAIGAAAAHGLSGIEPRGLGSEIDVTRLAIFRDDEIDATCQLLRRHGLAIPCLNTSIALVTPAPERWDMMLDECRRHALLANRADAPFLRIFGGRVPRGMTRPEAVFLACRHLRQLVKICSGHRCQPLLETHDDWAASDAVLELLASFHETEVGVLWDVEHPFRQGEPPQKTIAALGRRLRHVHLKDSVVHAGHNSPRLLGHGDLPLRDVLQSLRDAAYDDWICLATEKRWRPDEAPEPEQSIPQFVSFVRQHWQAPRQPEKRAS